MPKESHLPRDISRIKPLEIPVFKNNPLNPGIIRSMDQLVNNHIETFAFGSAQNATRSHSVGDLAHSHVLYSMDHPLDKPDGHSLQNHDQDVTAVTRLNKKGGTGIWYRGKETLMNIGMVEAVMTALNPATLARVIIVDETNGDTTFDLNQQERNLIDSRNPHITARIHVDQQRLEAALRGQTKIHQFFEKLKPLLKGRLQSVNADQVTTNLTYPIEKLEEIVPQIGKKEPLVIGFFKDDYEDLGVKSLLAGVIASMGYSVSVAFENEIPTVPSDGYHAVPLLDAIPVGTVDRSHDSNSQDDTEIQLTVFGRKVGKANGVLRDTPWAVRYYGHLTNTVDYLAWSHYRADKTTSDVVNSIVNKLETQGKTNWADLLQSIHFKN